MKLYRDFGLLAANRPICKASILHRVWFINIPQIDKNPPAHCVGKLRWRQSAKFVPFSDNNSSISAV
jgi:hypothetical protein